MNTSMRDMAKHRYLFHIMFHPIEGYEELRYNKKGSFMLANVVLLFWYICSIMTWQITGFVFNRNRPHNFNILLMAIGTIGVFILWVISNWSLCTLMDGEGKFVDIWIVSAYALVPYVLSMIPMIIFSNILVSEEGVFIQYASIFFQGWSLVLMIYAIKIVHQYTLKKTIVTMALTVVGIGIIIFLFILLFTLFQQVFTFLYTIYNELSFRF